MTKDRRRALSTLRISLSHRTTQAEIGAFLKAFDDCYGSLTGQGTGHGKI
jgi:cysteine desulfurase